MTVVDLTGYVPVQTLVTIGRLRTHLGDDWTLIGGMMVAVHLAEHGRPMRRTTADADIVVDLRVATGSARRVASALIEMGFEPQFAADGRGGGTAHRFRDEQGTTVDVLAPDGLGARADLTTVGNATTIRVPGSSQALRRSSEVTVQAQGLDEPVRLRVPNLLGALVVKARAYDVSDHPADQAADMAALLTLIDDPRAMRDEQTDAKDRRYLRRMQFLIDDPDHRAWDGLEDADQGRAALQILTRR